MKPHPALALLSNQFHNVIPENHSDPENLIQNNYCDKDELQHLKIPNKENSQSSHINSCSLNKNFEEIQDLYTTINKY